MILGILLSAGRYFELHPFFPKAFQSLSDPKWASLPAGKHPVDGDKLFVIVGHDPGRGRDGSTLESHRKYIDIQTSVRGAEEIGWAPLAECRQVKLEYDPERDLALYSDRPHAWIPLTPGHFAIFYPEDAHAPLAGTGPLHKVVMKVALDV